MLCCAAMRGTLHGLLFCSRSIARSASYSVTAKTSASYSNTSNRSSEFTFNPNHSQNQCTIIVRAHSFRVHSTILQRCMQMKINLRENDSQHHVLTLLTGGGELLCEFANEGQIPRLLREIFPRHFGLIWKCRMGW